MIRFERRKQLSGNNLRSFVIKPMMRPTKIKRLQLIAFTIALLVPAVAAQTVLSEVETGKAPVIIIPGLTGSDLVNSETGEEVWFKAQRSKDDDLRLPISPNLSRNRDNLVARDIIRSIKLFKYVPETEIYERLITTLETRGGYHEGKWDSPPDNGFEDTFYVFPYDWRRDNVENAQLLIGRIEALKRQLKKPDLKFNIVAHSMGGLIVRYAAMYGSADLRPDPKPNWAGARHIDKIFLVGTPNEGSVTSLDALLNGFSYIGGGVNIPFIQDIDRFDMFTIPSIYQLLPHQGTFKAFGDDLKPVSVDVYDPATWEKYDWSIWNDKDFTRKFSNEEQENARRYFDAVLRRAKLFQAAIDANTRSKIPVSFYLMGANCKETQNAILLRRDERRGRWETRFKPDSFVRANGEKVTAEQAKKLLFATGDGVVTKRSLSGESQNEHGRPPILPIVSELYQCAAHNKLFTNVAIQDKLLLLLKPAFAN